MTTPNWIDTASKDELSLLLFLETRAVDQGGRVNTVHMNSDDMEIARRWNASGFVGFGRVAAEHLTETGSHWCHLSDEAWIAVAQARKARAERGWKNRSFRTTDEKRAA